MERLSSFFKKFEKLTIPYREVREGAALFCSKHLKRPVDISKVRVSGKCIFLTLPPTLKGEILMHKKELLNYVNKKGNKILFEDVC